MKNVMFSTVIVLIISACAPPENPQIAIDEANTQVVHDYISAAVSGDVEAMGGFLADDYIAYGPAIADSATKENSLGNWSANWDSVFTAIDYDRTATTTKSFVDGPLQGDWVADWATISIDYKNGNSVKFRFNGVYRVEDGKITRSTSFYDVADIMTQQGFQIVPPGSQGPDEEATE